MIFNPHPYQIEAARHIAEHPCCALLADPGTGKTAITLAVLRGLKRRNPKHRALVLAPRRVMYDVWPNEISKWDQFNELTFAILHGPKKNEIVKTSNDIHLCNYEGLAWLAETRKLSQYHTLIIDESSKMKNWTAKRTLILKRYLGQFSRRHILTGSPMPRTLSDYFAQQYLVDRGESLGHSITAFRQEYFYDAAPKQQYSIWLPRRGAFDAILEKIKPFAYRLDGEQLLSLPTIQINDVKVSLELSDRAAYDKDEASAESAGAWFTAARQAVGHYKHEALDNLIESLQGKPVIVFFNFRAEGEQIAARYKCPLVYGGVSDKYVSQVVREWNAGELPVVCMNPSTTGHGLNLQDGGHHMVWFSLPTNQDDYYQGIRRLRRQGQRAHTVFVHRLLCPDTVDDRLRKLLDEKTEAQQKFLEEVKS